MNELQIINRLEISGKQFIIYGTLQDPLFLAKDVAEWINHSKAYVMIKPVDSSEKLILSMFSSGQNRQMWFLTEDGLYEVLILSRRPEAKQLKRAVKDILETIRKTGQNVSPGNNELVSLEKMETLMSNMTTQHEALSLRIRTDAKEFQEEGSIAISEEIIKAAQIKNWRQTRLF